MHNHHIHRPTRIHFIYKYIQIKQHYNTYINRMENPIPTAAYDVSTQAHNPLPTHNIGSYIYIPSLGPNNWNIVYWFYDLCRF